jgi:hypothetical protein
MQTRTTGRQRAGGGTRRARARAHTWLPCRSLASTAATPSRSGDGRGAGARNATMQVIGSRITKITDFASTWQQNPERGAGRPSKLYYYLVVIALARYALSVHHHHSQLSSVVRVEEEQEGRAQDRAS